MSNATLISFPVEDRAEVRTFSSVQQAQAAAEKVPNGPRFVLSDVTEKSLKALTVPLLTVVYNTAMPETDQVSKLRTKKDAVERVLPLIEDLAQPGEEDDAIPNEEEDVASKKSSKKSKKGKAGKKGKAAKKAKDDGNGRSSPLLGQKLYRVKGEPFSARMRKDSRRAKSLAVIKEGMLYETALEKGAHPDDITIMIRNEQLRAE